MDSNWFKEQFIDQAKPALDRHSSVGDSNTNIEEYLEPGLAATTESVKEKLGDSAIVKWDKETGMSELVDDVYEAGAKSGYDRFWDAYQQNGTRTDYRYAFSHLWNDESFTPKYDIVSTDPRCMFMYSRITNIKDGLERSNVALRLDQCESCDQIFQGSRILEIPRIDISNSISANWIFGDGCNCIIIDALVVSERTSFTNAFNTAYRLESITIEGTIGQDFNLQWSPLNVDSMKSIITHLKNYKDTELSGTKIVKFSDTCWEALLSDGTLAPDGSSWREYVEYTLSWLT